MNFKHVLTVLVIAGLLFSTASCTTSGLSFKSSTKSNTAKKKRHPHGGPPGQTKKKSYKSRKHVNTFYFGEFSK